MEIPHDLTKLKRCHLTLQEWETLNLKGGKRAFPNLCSVDAQGGNSNHERLSHKSSQQWCHSQSGSVNSATQQGTHVHNNRVHMYTTKTGYTCTQQQGTHEHLTRRLSMTVSCTAIPPLWLWSHHFKTYILAHINITTWGVMPFHPCYGEGSSGNNRTVTQYQSFVSIPLCQVSNRTRILS